MTIKVVLLGGGHAHVHVLESLIRQPIAATQITLISPYVRQVYSGMLPGWVAGHYRIDQCVIPLAPLAARAGMTFLEKSVQRIDLAARTVLCDDGSALAFDVVSIDTGPAADLSAIPGAAEHCVSIRPIESFITAFAAIRASVESGATRRIAFVGAGAGGIELAFAMQHAFRERRLGLTLISAANTLPGGAGRRLARILRERGIGLISGRAAVRIAPGAVYLDSGGAVEADHIIVATGASAAVWPGASGLCVDKQGFIVVNQYLQSVSHPNVFAAGDCASMENHPRPRSGVYAVRAGPPLAKNLRRYLQGESLKPYTPQARSLYLISTGSKYAVASWGNFAWKGRWVWRWKDAIDRAFVARYASASEYARRV